jgi:glutathione S-transferase
MLVVHHLGISQSERIVWLCEELGVPYELKLYKRENGRAPAEYKALHPLGTAPTITDGPVTLAESAAIIEYVCNKYGGGRFIVPPSAPNYADYLFWFHFTNSSLIANKTTMNILKLANAMDAPIGQFVRDRADQHWNMTEARLGQAPYLAGPELSAADFMMVYTLTTSRMHNPRDLSDSPNIRAYLQRVGDRPAYQRAMAKAEPDMAPLLT